MKDEKCCPTKRGARESWDYGTYDSDESKDDGENNHIFQSEVRWS